MIQEAIEKVNKLQNLSYDIYLYTIKNIKAGMNETDIAAIISKEFKRRGVEKYWYDIPIMVLIGEERFLEMKGDYEKKRPSGNHMLKTGDTINVDFTPMDKDGFWGDFSATCIFNPKTAYDFEKVEFLRLLRNIHRDGIEQITSLNTVKDVANLYLGKFEANNITLVDVRNNLGHSMHQGSKKYLDGSEKRIFIDTSNANPIGEGIFAIEPGGYRKSSLDKYKILVGKFEDCIYISTTKTPLLLATSREIPFIC